MATGPAAFFGGGKVGYITVHMQEHVIDGLADSVVLVEGGAIQQPKDFVIGVLSGSRLLGGDGSKGYKHGGTTEISQYIRVQILCWTRVMDVVGRTGESSGLSAHWVLSPYTGFFQEWGESCGCNGIG